MKYLSTLSKLAWVTPLVILITVNSVFAQLVVSPDVKPMVFAPGVISTAAGEFAPTFTPDGKKVYFTGGPDFIYYSKLLKGKWIKPVLCAFSGKWKDMDPFLSPDGKRMYFSSYRPDSGTMQLKFAHIWYVEHIDGERWSEPHHIDLPVNVNGVNNYAPAVSKTGTLYFYSPDRDAQNRSTYLSTRAGNSFSEPILVSISGEGGVHDPYISGDERFLIFASGGQLYISFKKNGKWTERKKLDEKINDGFKNSSPCLSPDRKTLYYSSSRENGILMMPVKINLF